MFKSGLKIIAIVVAAFLLHRVSFASEAVNLPTEELAQESVLPVFDKSVSVKNRNVVTEKRIEGSLFYGYAMTEAIANVSQLGGGIYYNTSEKHAFGLLFAKNFSGLSSYATQLDSQYKLKYGRAPAPEYSALFDYNMKAFYGKMSFTKKFVLNTLLFGTFGAGVIKYQNKSYPLGAIGIGQKFYFGKNFSLRADLRVFANQAPSPFLAGRMKETDPTPTYDQFEDKFQISTVLNVGVSYLF